MMLASGEEIFKERFKQLFEHCFFPYIVKISKIPSNALLYSLPNPRSTLTDSAGVSFPVYGPDMIPRCYEVSNTVYTHNYPGGSS